MKLADLMMVPAIGSATFGAASEDPLVHGHTRTLLAMTEQVSDSTLAAQKSDQEYLESLSARLEEERKVQAKRQIAVDEFSKEIDDIKHELETSGILKHSRLIGAVQGMFGGAIAGAAAPFLPGAALAVMPLSSDPDVQATAPLALVGLGFPLSLLYMATPAWAPFVVPVTAAVGGIAGGIAGAREFPKDMQEKIAGDLPDVIKLRDNLVKSMKKTNEYLIGEASSIEHYQEKIEGHTSRIETLAGLKEKLDSNVHTPALDLISLEEITALTGITGDEKTLWRGLEVAINDFRNPKFQTSPAPSTRFPAPV